jgi:hypothetical protein
LTIDDRYIEVKRWTGFASDPIRVSPGLRRLNVTITFNHGVGNPQMTAIIPTEVDVV